MPAKAGRISGTRKVRELSITVNAEHKKGPTALMRIRKLAVMAVLAFSAALTIAHATGTFSTASTATLSGSRNVPAVKA
jgi:hypothetical protein